MQDDSGNHRAGYPSSNHWHNGVKSGSINLLAKIEAASIIETTCGDPKQRGKHDPGYENWRDAGSCGAVLKKKPLHARCCRRRVEIGAGPDAATVISDDEVGTATNQCSLASTVCATAAIA